MIAKRVPRREATSSFHRLVHYILDTRNKRRKVAEIRVSNCISDDPVWAIEEVQATQSLNNRSKNDKTYHLVVSFPEGERPTKEQLQDIEKTLVETIGLSEHQRISTLHTDTDNVHLHIAINKVHPKTRRCVEPYYDKYRLDEACLKLEQRHGLIPDNRIEHSEKKRKEKHHGRNQGNAPRRDQNRTANRFKAKPNIGKVGTNPPPQSRNRLRNLSELGVVRLDKRSEVLLPSNVSSNMERERTERDDALRWNVHRRRVKGRAADLEAHTGETSFLRWMQEEAWPELQPVIKNAKNWQDVHHICAELDLEIRLRGAGLTIKARNSKVMIKPSQLDRGISFAALTKKLGPYQEPSASISAISPRKQYKRQPQSGVGEGTAKLYAEFQKKRNLEIIKRKEMREENRKYRQELAKWYSEKRMLIKNSITMSRIEKKAAYAALAQDRKTDYEKNYSNTKQRIEQNPMPNWQEFLCQRANYGDIVALETLRSREKRQRSVALAILSTPDLNAAKNVIISDLKPKTRKNGEVFYKLSDGGLVRDEKRQIRVDEISPAAVFAALTLAKERFGNQKLIVEGTAEFRQQIAAIAAIRGLDIQFDDPSIETARQRALAERPAQVRATEMQAFIEKRNSQRENVSTILYHRAWEPKDAGEAIYRGKRNLSDGSEAVLLERNKEMLVMPVTSAQGAKVSCLKLGSPVTVDKQQRFRKAQVNTL